MADTFTDMHQQLNEGRKRGDEIDYGPGARLAVARYVKRRRHGLDVEIELLDALGLGVIE